VLAVGPALRLELQDSHIDPHLEDLPAVGSLHAASQDLPGLKWPLLQNAIDIKPSGHRRSQKWSWR
jgi:hypothetical protein